MLYVPTVHGPCFFHLLCVFFLKLLSTLSRHQEYELRVLCLLSRWPLFSNFRDILTAAHQLILSASWTDLGALIYTLVSHPRPLQPVSFASSLSAVHLHLQKRKLI